MPKNASRLTVLTGSLEPFIQEGIHWSFQEKGKEGLDGLRPLEKGDILIVFSNASRKKEIWRGVIDLDTSSHIRPLPLAPHLKAQWVDGIGTVHGLQKGVSPKEWSLMFLRERPAVLIPVKGK